MGTYADGLRTSFVSSWLTPTSLISHPLSPPPQLGVYACMQISMRSQPMSATQRPEHLGRRRRRGKEQLLLQSRKVFFFLSRLGTVFKVGPAGASGSETRRGTSSSSGRKGEGSIGGHLSLIGNISDGCYLARRLTAELTEKNCAYPAVRQAPKGEGKRKRYAKRKKD